MAYANPDALVTTEWLAANLDTPGVKVVDASHYAPKMDRNAREEFEESHIPGAVFLDIDTVADTSTGLPHMVPTAEAFAEAVGALGIGNGDRVICYDGTGVASAAARVWWMFRLFGHDKVAVLDGGLPKWFREDRPLAEGAATPTPTSFTATLRPTLLRTRDQVQANVDSGAELLVDGRPAQRFAGGGEENYPVLVAGHVPGSVNLPFLDLVDPREMTFHDATTLQQAFTEAGVDFARPVVTSCGSGVTACVLNLGAYLLGHEQVALYDGSWAEWGNHPELPRVDGEG